MQFLHLGQNWMMVQMIDKWQYGRRYNIALRGNLLTARERGVTLGSVRSFNVDRLNNISELYYAERQSKSILHPLRAPIIWWRKLDRKENA